MLYPPSRLKVVVEVIRSYVTGKECKPLVVCGPMGCGKKWWTKQVLEEYGYEPFFSFDVKPIGVSLGNVEAKRFPVYFSGNVIPNYRAIYLIDSEEEVDTKTIRPVLFPEPTTADMLEYLSVNKLPAQLAEGVSDYATLINAIKVWKATGLVQRGPSPVSTKETWDNWKRGGPAPYSGPLFCWYYAYHEPFQKTWVANHSSWLMTRIKAKIYRLVEWAPRLLWSGGWVTFPPPLKTAKTKTFPGGKGLSKAVPRKTARAAITW